MTGQTAKVFKKYSVSLDRSNYEILVGKDIITIISEFLADKTKDKRILIVIDEFFRAKISEPLEQSLSDAGFSVYSYF